MFTILTFDWYIRFILEMNQYILISTIYEVFLFNRSDLLRIISLVLSFCVLFCCIILIAFTIFLTFSSYEVSEENHNKLGEFFCGIKMQKKCKLYLPALLCRRITFVTLIVTLGIVKSWILICILSIIQLCYIIFLFTTRPFIETKANIIEIINEIYFSLYLSGLVYLNSEENWTSFYESIYIWTITSNTIVVFVILFTEMIRNLIIKIKSCCSSTKDKDATVTPIITQPPSIILARETNPCSTINPKPTNKGDSGFRRRNHYVEEESKIDIQSHDPVTFSIDHNHS